IPFAEVPEMMRIAIGRRLANFVATIGKEGHEKLFASRVRELSGGLLSAERVISPNQFTEVGLDHSRVAMPLEVATQVTQLRESDIAPHI
ncbi:MAG: hypothetical protein GTO49_13060, partial [Anaerolineae bacterium]|nr:hypothetical protein [Anaerolineae bacterium]